MHGGYGNDKIEGDEGDDLLYGEYGDDKIFGGEGADVIWGDDKAGPADNSPIDPSEHVAPTGAG